MKCPRYVQGLERSFNASVKVFQLFTKKSEVDLFVLRMCSQEEAPSEFSPALINRGTSCQGDNGNEV